MKILISRTDKIGDLVLSFPVAKFIKSVSPSSEVFYIVRKGLGKVVSRAKYIDRFFEIATYGERGDIKLSEALSLSNFLRKHKFDYCFMLYPKPLLALLMKINGIKVVGTSRRFFSFLFDIKVNVSRKQNLFHEAYYNLLILSPIFDAKNVGLSDLFGNLRPEIFVDDEECQKVKKKFSLPENFIVFHIFSGGSSPTLPQDYFLALSEKMDVPVVWVGRDEKFSQDTGKIICLVNKTDLDELICVLNLSSWVVSPSSGPIHLASACGKPVIGFYRTKDMIRWMPLNPNSLIFDVEDPPTPDTFLDTVKHLGQLHIK